jgi:hypothetical protein
MERSLISWNLPNLITVPLMAVVGWLLIACIWQLARRATGAANDNTTGTSGGELATGLPGMAA